MGAVAWLFVNPEALFDRIDVRSVQQNEWIPQDRFRCDPNRESLTDFR